MPNMNSYLTEDFPENLSIDIGAKHSFKNSYGISNLVYTCQVMC